MRNPWLDMPHVAPFVASDDVQLLTDLSARLKGKCELRLDLFPQPWTGDINTFRMLALALNPGLGPGHLPRRTPAVQPPGRTGFAAHPRPSGLRHGRRVVRLREDGAHDRRDVLARTL